MRYAGMIKNDIAAGPGVCVSFFTQGCPFHCKGCHNPETWDYDGGREFTDDTMNELLEALRANGVHRDLCIMGGEPLSPPNIPLVKDIIKIVKTEIRDIKIYIWTGYYYEDIKDTDDLNLQYILNHTECIIDGPYIEELRDITLEMRGSKNQKIYKRLRGIADEHRNR